MQTITSQEVLQDLRQGATCFVVMRTKKKKSAEEHIMGIPIMEEFVDVFPDEVLELPPSREVGFAIDLMLGTRPLSMAPYRMTLTELAELKKQIKYLLDRRI